MLHVKLRPHLSPPSVQVPGHAMAVMRGLIGLMTAGTEGLLPGPDGIIDAGL